MDELIGAVLSQHTSDLNSRRAFAALRAAYGSWAEAAEASAEQIADSIRRGGLADQKAPRIKAILSAVSARAGSPDLSWLAEAPLEEARRYLTALPGVGAKTAACVLLFALNRAAFPVDTHVQRVARRLGLVDATASAQTTQEYLESEVPNHQMYAYHVNLIRHGRQVCKARSPRCGACGLSGFCRYYGQAAAARGLSA